MSKTFGYSVLAIFALFAIVFSALQFFDTNIDEDSALANHAMYNARLHMTKHRQSQIEKGTSTPISRSYPYSNISKSRPGYAVSISATSNPPQTSKPSTSTVTVSNSLPQPILPAGLPGQPIDSVPTRAMQWGAYVGDGSTALADFESMVGAQVDILADFEGWNNDFPSALSSKVGAKGKTLLVFWEPDFGYDQINNGSKDAYIRAFATQAKQYSYPVILAPFDEMNLNEEAWGYSKNNNTAEKFKIAWKHIHGIFEDVGATNVKFSIAYNNVSIPNVSGNYFSDYYPGGEYVDYVGVDGFNFANPWTSFAGSFDSAITSLNTFGKPIYILSTASVPGSTGQKASWIQQGLGEHVYTYQNVIGWIWFNQNGDQNGPNNWLVNSDQVSLDAFRKIVKNL